MTDDVIDDEAGAEKATDESDERAYQAAEIKDGGGEPFAECLACGFRVTGVYCSSCGQKNDDLRRSSLVLARQFVEDTFAFDSRMWSTLGMMAVAPGLVPANYSHGRRSRYTPPVRLFLVVSFLFFLVLGVTQTMFVAVEVTPRAAAVSEPASVDMSISEKTEAERDTDPFVIDNAALNCGLKTKLRFFVGPKDVKIDQEAWRACADSIRKRAELNLVPDDSGAPSDDSDIAIKIVNKLVGGMSAMVEDPLKFNSEVNAWLPRVVLLMTPVLALLLGLFIRGRDALLFDHLVLSFYTHAVGFAVVGAAIIAAQLGVPHAGAVAVIVLAIYFLAAIKRAYKRGWIKTILAGGFIAFFYFITLSGVVMAIVSNAVWRSV